MSETPFEPSAWIQESYGTYRLLCFDEWEAGQYVGEDTQPEVWTMSLVETDIEEILDDMREGRSEVFTQDLLAYYDSEAFDFGTGEYDRFVEEVEDGQWTPIDEFVAERL